MKAFKTLGTILYEIHQDVFSNNNFNSLNETDKN
jgi:hypothetical protein